MPSFNKHRSKGNCPPPQSLQSDQLPTPWSDWVWSATYNKYFQYRQIAATGVDENDYEYNYEQDNEAPRSQKIDPAAVALAAISESTELVESSQEHPQDLGYTYDPPVDKITEAFSQTSISNEAHTQSQPLATASISQYNQGRGRSNSFGAGPSDQQQRGGAKEIINRRVRTLDSSTTVDLDPDYTVRPSTEFVFGKVFKVLWSEPTGSTGTEITGFKNAKFGQKAYHSIRRFVIVDDRNAGHALCLPILTYGGRATTKKGVHAKDHAVIYTGKVASQLKEEKLIKRPIRMVPYSSRHHLDATSRINYAKVYTVEHNVKVFFIGSISPKYEQQVITDYNNTHGPLPDRPYAGDMTDDEFSYAEGQDPRFSARKASSSTLTPWQAPLASTQTLPNDTHPSTAMASSYGPTITSSWSTTPQSSSLYVSSAPYVSATTSSGTYTAPDTSGEVAKYDPLYDVSD